MNMNNVKAVATTEAVETTTVAPAPTAAPAPAAAPAVKTTAIEEISKMNKSQVLNALSSLDTWDGIKKYLDGIPSRWVKMPVKKILKTEVAFATSVNKIKGYLMIALENHLLKADTKELREIIKKSNKSLEEDTLFKNKMTSFERVYIDRGEYEVRKENGEQITVGSAVILQTISDIKADIVENNKKLEESKAETKALARILRRQFI